MSNFEYIKENLSEREFTELILTDWPDCLWETKIGRAFERWCNRQGKGGNYLRKGERIPVWQMEYFFIGESPEAQKLGRTDFQSFSQWLILKYNPADWE